MVVKWPFVSLLTFETPSTYFKKIHLANRRKAKTRNRFYSTTSNWSNMSEKLGLQSLQDYCLPQRSLPILGILIGSFVGIVMTIFSDSFVLLRDCRGNCMDSTKKFDEWKAALG